MSGAKVNRVLTLQPLLQHVFQDSISVVKLHPSGRALAACSWAGELAVMELVTNDPSKIMTTNESLYNFAFPILFLEWDQTGNGLFLALANGEVVHRPISGVGMRTVAMLDTAPVAMTLLQEYLVLADGLQKVSFWNGSSDKPVKILPFQLAIRDIDGNQDILAVLLTDGNVTGWRLSDIQTQSSTRSIWKHAMKMNTLNMKVSSRGIIANTSSGRIKINKMDSENLIIVPKEQVSPVVPMLEPVLNEELGVVVGATAQGVLYLVSLINNSKQTYSLNQNVTAIEADIKSGILFVATGYNWYAGYQPNLINSEVRLMYCKVTD